MTEKETNTTSILTERELIELRKILGPKICSTTVRRLISWAEKIRLGEEEINKRQEQNREILI